MRYLHTSDWHLGRSFHRVGLLEAQAEFLASLVEVVRAERVDAVLVAGDVYDRALPSVDAVAVLDDALAALTAAGATVVISSGNHDSARRLGFASRLLSRAGVHVRTDPAGCGDPVLVSDHHGEVAVYPIPYLEPLVAAGALECEPTHRAVLDAAMARVRADLATRPRGTRSVVTAHAFVVGAQISDSERDIAVGGVAAVPASVFAGVDDVALGHLHGAQHPAEGVRYSGSPLAYSFSEHGHQKGSWLVDLDGSGRVHTERVPAPVPRRLAVLRGDLQDLLTAAGLARHEGDWCQVTLTDAIRPADAMARLRVRFPHTLELRFSPAGEPGVTAGAPAVAGRDDVAVCCDFLQYVRGRPVDDAELALLGDVAMEYRLAQAEEAGAARLSRSRRTTARRASPASTPSRAVGAGAEAAG